MHRKTRRGMTNIVETIACLVLFSLLLTILLSLMAYANGWTIKAQKSMDDKLQADYFIESIQADVKSAATIDVVGNDLQILTAEELVVYSVQGDTIYRNEEKAIDEIISAMFVPDDGNSVGIYIKLQNGDLVDMTLHK